MKRTICLLLILCIAPTLSAQTIGVPWVNDLFVDIGATGATAGPPFGGPCGVGPPIPIPWQTPFTIGVTAPAPGLRVMLFVNLTPCAPGAFCLPPVFGPYALIPPCPAPCGPNTNQSIDLPLGTVVLSTGFTVPSPLGPGGIYTSPVFIGPGAGIIVSVQGVIFDPAGGGILSMVMTNAMDLMI